MEVRQWPQETVDEAHRLYIENGPTATSRIIGVPYETIRRWARVHDWAGERKAFQSRELAARATTSQEEARTAQAEYRQWLSEADMATERRRMQNRAAMVDQVAELLSRMNEPHIEYKGNNAQKVDYETAPSGSVKDYAIAIGILVDKLRIEFGEVTERTEHIGPDRVMEEIQRLEAELAINDG